MLIVVGVSVFFIYRKTFSPVEVKGITVRRQNIGTSVSGTSARVIKSEVAMSIAAGPHQ